MPDFEMMGLLSWIVMGLLAGALARFLTPGEDAMGCLLTIVTGVVGAIVGGLAATLLGFGGFRGIDIYSVRARGSRRGQPLPRSSSTHASAPPQDEPCPAV